MAKANGEEKPKREPKLLPKKPPLAHEQGTASLTLRIVDKLYMLRRIQSDVEGVQACYELKKRGSPDRYHISQFEHGCECTCADWTFRREHTDRKGCKHIRALAAFGLLENHPAPIRDVDLEPLGSARGMTRTGIEAKEYMHPFEAKGLGPAPYQILTAVRLPSVTEVMAATRQAAIENAERLFRIKPGFCYVCRNPKDETFVITDSKRHNAAVCRACCQQSQDGGLLKRIARLDHQREELYQQYLRDQARHGKPR